MSAARAQGRPSKVIRESARFRQEAQALGARIRELRHEREWTLEEASGRMNLDLKHLQKLEAGSVNATLVTLLRVADGFQLPIAALFRDTRSR